MVVLGSLVATGATAQEASITVGGTHARYADSLSGTAGMLGARFSFISRTSYLRLEGGLSQFSSGEWASQIGTQGSLIHPLTGGIGIAVQGSGTMSNYETGSWSGTGALGSFLVFSGKGSLASVGASAGRLRAVDTSVLNFQSGFLRASRRLSPGVTVEGGVSATNSDTTFFTDVTLGARLRSENISISLTAGARTGDLADDPWLVSMIGIKASPRSTIELSFGRYPRDLVGFTSGAFASAAVRFSFGTSPRGQRQPIAPVSVTRLDGRRVRLTIRYSHDPERLEIAGPWNQWTPVPLLRRGRNEWVVELELSPGLHRYALLVNGTDWTTPSEVPTIDDGFGGKVALVTVP